MRNAVGIKGADDIKAALATLNGTTGDAAVEAADASVTNVRSQAEVGALAIEVVDGGCARRAAVRASRAVNAARVLCHYFLSPRAAGTTSRAPSAARLDPHKIDV